MLVMDKMFAHPFAANAGGPGDGGVDGLVDLAPQRAGGSDRGRLARRVEDGERQ